MIYIINKKSLLEEASKHKPEKPRMIIMKGNPKYYIKPQSNIFYQTLKNLAKKFGFEYEDYESDIWADEIKDYKKLSKKDVIIGFSRGCWYARVLKNKLHIKTNFIGIGCYSNKNEPQDYQIKNPLDKTQKNDMSKQSIKNHWIITPNMKNSLIKLLIKIKGLK